MDHQQVILEVWREVCRHIELDAAVGRIAAIIGGELPVAGLEIEYLDRSRHALETVASSRKRGHGRRTSYTALGFTRLLTWCERNVVVGVPAGAAWPEELAPLAPSYSNEHVLFGTLPDEQGKVIGIAVWATPSARDLSPVDERLFHGIREALAAAVCNDTRLRELATLRAAAEADKASLLTRLGRDEVAESVVGANGGLRPVMERVELVARSDTSVLLLGETGSGKEVVARAIHDRSPRARGPFIRVNCGALPPELIDSELFGHEKGSFTGAVGQRKGWFERAHGGTLFLDEVGELPAAVQVRLLRVLQDGTLNRVGGENTLEVDVRIIAATHRDLATMVSEGRFRQDLWYRVAVFPILLPPLRERQEDIPELAGHLARRAAVKLGLPLQLPTAEDIALLRGYPWPGNVREMASVIERAAILGNGRGLEVAAALGVNTPSTQRPAPAESTVTSQPLMTLDQAIIAHIKEALRRTHGRIEGFYGAARLLEINPHTLRSRMRKLGIDARHFRGFSE
jgi:transcriptional regulator with GAF, ATPase, and Fis domain